MWTLHPAARRIAAAAALLACGFVAPVRPAARVLPPDAQGLLPAHASRTELTAAFLYRFAEFVTWPEGRGSGPFVIGIVGDDEVADALQTMIAGRTIHGRPVQVARLDSPSEITRCQIAFLGRNNACVRPDLLARASGHHVLTVSRRPDFARNGGVIDLVPAGGDLRLEINLGAARCAGLHISSLLLKLAVIVGAPQR